MSGADPISAIATAVSDLALLITKALPDDEQKLAAFKIRSPWMYARIQRRIVNSIVSYCRRKKFSYGAAQNYALIETEDLPVNEQQLIWSVVAYELFPGLL